jgi:hypothetical protein
MSTLHCALCNASEEQKPLLSARFEGAELRFCPSCMPTLIHGMEEEELRLVLRRKLAAGV